MHSGTRPGGMTRRQLLRMIGMTAGSAAMYQAMTQPRLCRRVEFQRRSAARCGAQGCLRARAGCGHRRHGRRLRIAQGRLSRCRCSSTTRAPAGATGACAAAIAIPSWVARPSTVSSIPACISIPVHGACHIITAASSAIAGNSISRSRISSRSTTTPACTDSTAADGKPQRYRAVRADYHGHVAELLAKATQGSQLDAAVSKEDQEKLLASLQWWGALDKNYKYNRNRDSSDRRGYDKDAGGGLGGEPVASAPMGLKRRARYDLVGSTAVWRPLRNADHADAAGRRHGPHRHGLRARTGWPDPLPGQSRRHPSGRQRRACQLRGHRLSPAADTRPVPTGAYARFRCRSSARSR